MTVSQTFGVDSWWIVDSPKKSRPRWTAAWSVTFVHIPPYSVVLVEVIPSHPLDFGRKFVVRSNRPSPCEVQLLETCENYVAISASGFRTPWFFWIFWMQQVSLSLLSHDCSMIQIQIQKTLMIPDFEMSRQVSSLLQPSTRQGMHLSAFLENSTLRRVLNFFLPSRQVSLWMLWVSPALLDAIGWFTDEELVETVDVRFIAVGFDFATILSSFFLFLQLVKLKVQFLVSFFPETLRRGAVPQHQSELMGREFFTNRG